MLGLVRVPALPEPQQAVQAAAAQDLLKTAARVLGYKPTQPSPLARLLASLDIKPFDRRHVDRYKEAHRFIIPHTWRGIGGALLALVTVWTSVFLIEGFTRSWGDSQGWAMVPAIIVALGISICTGVMTFASAYVWRESSLSSYGDLVPQFALETAMRIHQAAAAQGLQAQLYVDERLWEDRTRSGDPFLYVAAQHPAGFYERFYVEVWDEPSFTEERKV